MKEIRSKLNEVNPYLAVMFDGATSILNTNNFLKYSFCSLALRELLKQYFMTIADEQEVRKCCWYIPTIHKGKPIVTRRDSVKFSIYKYVNTSYFPSFFVDEVEEVSDRYLAQVDELSKWLHITEKILTTKDREMSESINTMLETIREIMDLVHKGEEWFIDTLNIHLKEKLSYQFWLTTFDDLDCLSTHTRPSGVEDVEVKVSSINEEYINFEGTALVECDLQYGSDGDCRRGDGIESSGSYPFTFVGHAEVKSPETVYVDEADINIDTSPFYE